MPVESLSAQTKRGLAWHCPKKWNAGIRCCLRCEPGAPYLRHERAARRRRMHCGVFAAAAGGMYDTLAFAHETVDGPKTLALCESMPKPVIAAISRHLSSRWIRVRDLLRSSHRRGWRLP